MSKGKKNYFRHSFSAHEDLKLQKFMDLVGPAGYLYFFTLCEIAAKQCTENDEDPKDFKAKIHPRNLASIWKTQRNKLGMILEHSRNILGIFSECSENEVVYLVPNLWKYFGSYDSYSDKQNKIKGNKIKGNKTKEAESDQPSFDFESVYKKYPRKTGKEKGFKKIKSEIKTQDQFNSFQLAVENYSKSVTAKNTEQNYIKQFSTFCSCWTDWVNPDPRELNPVCGQVSKFKKPDIMDNFRELTDYADSLGGAQ